MNRDEINIDRLIKASNSDEVFIRAMLNLFIERTPGMIDEMMEACEKKDHQQTKRLAHKLKPSVDMMGNDRLSDLLFEIHEIIINESNYKRSFEQIEIFKKQTEKVIDLIEEKLKQQKLIQSL